MNRKPVDLQVIETEVLETLEQLSGQRGAAAHADIGRLSAEAVMSQYEAAAKSVEEMGVEVKTRINALEAALRDCDADMKLIGEAADAIREKGKVVFTQIEHTAAVSKEIRTVCSDFHSRIA